MKSTKIKDMILSFTDDVVLDYNGETICINPWNEKKYEVAYKDDVKTYSDIDDLMCDPFYDGKTLKEIANDIEI